MAAPFRITGRTVTELTVVVVTLRDGDLKGLNSPIPIAADESAQELSDVATLVGRFEVINIKLDKCGGLTEALAMAKEARRLGLVVMVGNMLGTSLAMAPAFLVK